MLVVVAVKRDVPLGFQNLLDDQTRRQLRASVRQRDVAFDQLEN